MKGLPASTLETVFANVKSAAKAPEEVLGRRAAEVAADCGFFASRSDARRMAQQGGLSLNAEKIGFDRVLGADDFIDGRVAVLRAGKKNHFLLKLKGER